MKLYEAKIVYNQQDTADILLNSPELIAKFAREKVYNDLDPTKETAVIYALNRHNKLIAFNILSVGSSESCLIDKKQLYKFLVLSSATAFVMTHNHPSGLVAPSTADIRITGDIRQSAMVMGIEFLDHVIIGEENIPENPKGFYSFREAGMV